MLAKRNNKQVFACASRGRDPDNPRDRSTGNPNLVQRIEINWSGYSNTISTVNKDCYVLEIYE